MKKILMVLGCYGFVVSSAEAGDRWPPGPCADLAQRRALIEKAGLLGTDKPMARVGLLLLQRDHCGVSVKAELAADRAQLQAEVTNAENALKRQPARPAPEPRRPLLCDTTPKAYGGSYTDCF